MVDALRKLDKKFLIIAALIILLPIVLIIFLAILRGCDAGKTTYSEYEKRMITAAEKYFKNKGNEPKLEGEVATVSLSNLVDEDYIKSPSKSLDDDSCKGNVYVRRNGASVESTNGGYLNYIVSLECDKYKTETILSKLKENIVTSESGLYEYENGYVFRGNKVKNYINLNENIYRIVSIYKDGIMKLIKVEPEVSSRIWDNKYNSEAKQSFGKTIYKDSTILLYLLKDYSNAKIFPTKVRKHLVASDVCIGKRSKKDKGIDYNLDCSEKIENQVVALLNISDFARASIDEECDSIMSRSCANYNYLSSVAQSTWTTNANSDNSYEVFFISDGIAYSQPASNYNLYNLVVFVDGNEIYTEGNGSSTSPYIIK